MINSFTIGGRYDELVDIARLFLDAGITAFITASLVVQPKDELQHALMMRIAYQKNKNVMPFREPDPVARPNGSERTARIRRSW